MEVAALGYIGLGVRDVDAWRTYARDFLGLVVSECADGGLRLRADSRDWRIAIHPTGEDDIVYAGWELRGSQDLEALIERVRAAGTDIALDADLAAARGVMELARCIDPAGVACEFHWGPTDRQEIPFASPAGVSGFLTGAEGLGHIVIASDELAGLKTFYQDVLGFRFSDYIDMPVGPGMTIPVSFLHCNPRHHSFAYAPAMPGNPTRLVHFMLQARSLDDVGFALDRLHRQGVELALTLGRHGNDQMVSFYAVTPSGFEVEFGWGAISIDEASWMPARHERTSAWGHHHVRTSGQPGA